MTPRKPADPQEKKKSPLQEVRELGGVLFTAVLMAVAIKYLLIDVFVIPSGSMEPTLHGRPDGGDRVLCTKVNYYWRDPARWEIFVFEFPFEQATQYVSAAQISAFKGQNFIKRCIGLPGETVALAKGDVYTSTAGGDWQRQVKPDRVQRALWIPVYEEDFSELVVAGEGRLDDFLTFWKPAGIENRVEITPERTLLMEAGEPMHLIYQPRIRGGIDGDRLITYRRSPTAPSAIPDRYIVRQAVTFTCPECGGQFRKTISNQKIAGRCPHCKTYVTEENVVHYFRRSDIPVGDGEFARIGSEILRQGRQGEATPRGDDYHPVGDLRIATRVRFGSGATRLAFELRDGERLLTAVLDAGAGTAEITLDGRPASPDQRLPLTLSEGWHDVEFYTVDGEARLFVDGQEKPVLTWAAGPQPKPSALAYVPASGVMISVSGGTVELDDIRIDRDIYYYSVPGSSQSAMQGGGIFHVPDDGYMALGDNSPSSNDSRHWGSVPVENRKGPAILVWWPLRRIHPLVMP